MDNAEARSPVTVVFEALTYHKISSHECLSPSPKASFAACSIVNVSSLIKVGDGVSVIHELAPWSFADPDAEASSSQALDTVT